MAPKKRRKGNSRAHQLSVNKSSVPNNFDCDGVSFSSEQQEILRHVWQESKIIPEPFKSFQRNCDRTIQVLSNLLIFPVKFIVVLHCRNSL
jgi:hypothetical protein